MSCYVRIRRRGGGRAPSRARLRRSPRLVRLARRGTSGGLVPAGPRGCGPPGVAWHGTSPLGCKRPRRPGIGCSRSRYRGRGLGVRRADRTRRVGRRLTPVAATAGPAAAAMASRSAARAAPSAPAQGGVAPRTVAWPWPAALAGPEPPAMAEPNSVAVASARGPRCVGPCVDRPGAAVRAADPRPWSVDSQGMAGTRAGWIPRSVAGAAWFRTGVRAGWVPGSVAGAAWFGTGTRSGTITARARAARPLARARPG